MSTEEPECVEASITDSENKSVPVRLLLYPDALLIQKQEWVNVPLDEEDEVFLNMVREVEITREPGSGFGLFVKGGAEHRLPVLISRMKKNQAAERCKQLLVGDAILRVNGVNVESSTHDEVVSLLKEVEGDTVSLSVRHFRPASYFLNKGNESKGKPCTSSRVDSLSNLPRLEKEWMTALTIPLLYARISCYINGTDKLRNNSFDVLGVEGSKSGPLFFEETETMTQWYHTIAAKMQGLLTQMIEMTNQLMTKEDHIHLMCWAHQKMRLDQHHVQAWKEQFVAIKAADVYVFDSPPMHASDWSKCENRFKVYECMLKLLKDCELVDKRQHCCIIRTGSRREIYLSVDSREELVKLEKIWHLASNQAVKGLVSKTFGCSWQGHLSGLMLDLDQGFSLYDHNTKSMLWTYRFSQLKMSSDDGVSKLILNFMADESKQMEKQVIDCSDLQTLIFCIHSFLSAKLSTVDPTFLANQ